VSAPSSSGGQRSIEATTGDMISQNVRGASSSDIRSADVRLSPACATVEKDLAAAGMDVLNQWWYDPPSRATMQDCRNTAVGVWSENSLARSVVVAVYGQPAGT
jgi:hypothetical protein